MTRTMARSEIPKVERRSGVDRRSAVNRRGAVDLWREMGRPGFELRGGRDRRSGADRRRGGKELRDTVTAEIVTPWQLPPPRR